MQTLVDTSIWINYFRSGDHSGDLDFLIEENLVVTNDLILTELIPYSKKEAAKQSHQAASSSQKTYFSHQLGRNDSVSVQVSQKWHKRYWNS